MYCMYSAVPGATLHGDKRYDMNGNGVVVCAQSRMVVHDVV